MNRKPLTHGNKVGLAAVAALALSFGGIGAAAATPANAASPGGAFAPGHPSASVANDTLTITGTNGPDQITAHLADGDPNQLIVSFGPNGTPSESFARDTFSGISVFLRAGDDSFVETGTTLPDEPLTVSASSGDDTIVAGPGTDVISGGDGNDNIHGGPGDDVITAGRGDDLVDGDQGHDTAFLGTGQDSFVWDAGDGSDLVDGSVGYDTLVFNGASGNEVMSLSANDFRSVFLRQPGNIRMDMDGVEQLTLNPLGGADVFTQNDMTGTDFRQVNVNLAVEGAGDQAADTVTVNGTDRADRVNVRANHGQVGVEGLQTRTDITGSEPTDHLQVNTLGGNDRASVGNDVPPLIGVAVDLGSGQS